ncbi:hypothetical protein [Anaerocolumna sp. MB42-C2]|uniref:hypothetical protein n=1 Tax=Anaerocolumna sp. MB42-C2 TaxID=3070997 RepID=UPI0027DF7367|nr:hypothetical protein [Anaerocolumna sp. MB42-C2]WMJ86025.1 hypothetical protein RBU59_18545 [Anaerocolumna sp. MB42-C2]
MKIKDVPFSTVDWNTVKPTIHPGITGEAYWRTFELGNIRVRLVEYSPGYIADQVAEDINPHRTHTEKGAKLFIVD